MSIKNIVFSLGLLDEASLMEKKRKKHIQKKKRKLKITRKNDGKIEVLVEGTSGKIVEKQKKRTKL